MDHAGLAPPVLADATRRETGVGNEVVHPLSTELVPLPQSMQLPANQRAQTTPSQRRTLQISVHLVPGVTHGCVHITDVQLVRRRQHTLGNQVAAADHQLSSTKIDLFDGKGQQRQVLLHMAAPPRQALNRAGEDGSSVQPTARPSRFGVDQGRHLRLAAEAAQKGINLLNNLFCSTDRTRREPLMNQSDALREVIRSRGHPSGMKRTLRSLSAHCRSRPRSRCWCTCPARTSRSTSSWRRR